jgi:3alpha(or 20beta)-hydroxysteroid dehydrogenase
VVASYGVSAAIIDRHDVWAVRAAAEAAVAGAGPATVCSLSVSARNGEGHGRRRRRRGDGCGRCADRRDPLRQGYRLRDSGADGSSSCRDRPRRRCRSGALVPAAPARSNPSPVACLAAIEHDVALADLAGGGPGGRIVKADVLAARSRVADRTVEFRRAVRDALDEELARDDRGSCFGEDVAKPGGVFAATPGVLPGWPRQAVQVGWTSEALLDTALACVHDRHDGRALRHRNPQRARDSEDRRIGSACVESGSRQPRSEAAPNRATADSIQQRSMFPDDVAAQRRARTHEVTAMKLENEVALITGGARGMGAAHARALLAEGAKVVIADVLDEQGGALAAELGPDTIYVRLDVTSEDDWAGAIKATEDRFGTVTVLVNNAGIFNAEVLEDYSLKDWDDVIAVDLTGTFLGMKHVAAGMKAARHGSIINISSVMGMRGAALSYAYCAAKWGVRGLTKCAAIELGGYGIRVNSVLPGFIETPMTEDQDFSVLEIPLRRSAEASELSNFIVFLASEGSAFSTAAEYVVDGGQTAGMPRYDSLHGIILAGPVDAA